MKAEEGVEPVTLAETKKNLTKKPIEQLGFIKDINSLVVLSGISAPMLAYFVN